jgi:hypothetical protein
MAHCLVELVKQRKIDARKVVSIEVGVPTRLRVRRRGLYGVDGAIYAGPHHKSRCAATSEEGVGSAEL